MRVQARRESAVVIATRRSAWKETGWAVLGAAISALAVVVAARGLEAVPPALLWLVAGGSLADTLTAGSRAWRTWRQWRRSTQCAVCRLAQGQAVIAEHEQRAHARSGYPAVTT